MVIVKDISKKVLLKLLKEISIKHIITSLAEELKISRVGMWKILKKLEFDQLVILEKIGKGKTSTFNVLLNWDNMMVEKLLEFYLSDEASRQQRWRDNFKELEKELDFLILYGSILYSQKEAKDIDIIGVGNEKKFNSINNIISRIQKTQAKKIHFLNFTRTEFKHELNKQNKAFIDSIKKGVVLFGQENFIKFIRDVKI